MAKFLQYDALAPLLHAAIYSHLYGCLFAIFFNIHLLGSEYTRLRAVEMMEYENYYIQIPY